MNKIHIVRNEDVNRVLIGVPKGHKHLRISIELKKGVVLILQESTMANILRACTTVKTHPTICAQELEMKKLIATLRKDGYATHQLLETPRTNEDVKRELKELLDKGAFST